MSPHGGERFPAWSGTRRALADAAASPGESGDRVAGRYSRGATRDILEDESAVLAMEPGAERPPHGSQVAGLLVRSGGAWRLQAPEVLAPSSREIPAEIRSAAARRGIMRQRAAVIACVRSTFTARGFLEVETPARVFNPGLEPHLRPFASPGAWDGERWLVTSPELHLKRLLAAGYERFFELARVFRDEERGALHVPEFLMLEWYRSHARLDDLAGDLAELLPRCAEAAGADPGNVRRCDLTRPPLPAAYSDVFRDLAGTDPLALPPDERERVFSASVEPSLGREQPCLLVDWPEDACALARLRATERGVKVAARAELYIAGIELANGFDELNDPAEQRRRHEADRASRAAAGQPVPPLDDGFLAALESGAPPAAGMALGVDRLVMLLLDLPDVASTRLFAG